MVMLYYIIIIITIHLLLCLVACDVVSYTNQLQKEFRKHFRFLYLARISTLNDQMSVVCGREMMIIFSVCCMFFSIILQMNPAAASSYFTISDVVKKLPLSAREHSVIYAAH